MKSYRRGGRRETVTLSAQEFLRQFLHHTLPKRFRKIRYGGFMVCTVRQEKLAQARRALGVTESVLEFQKKTEAGTETEDTIKRRRRYHRAV